MCAARDHDKGYAVLVLQMSSAMRQAEICLSSARSYEAGFVVASEDFSNDAYPKKSAITC